MPQLEVQEIQNLIAEAILEHRLTPGQRLNEAQLAKACGVSRSAVRFTLIALENEGLVTIEQNRGAFVAKPTLEEAVQLFQALAALEKAAAELTLIRDRKTSSVKLAELEALHRREVLAQKNGESILAIQLSIEFHLCFVSLAKNSFLEDIHRKLLMQYRLVTSIFRTSMDCCTLDDHHLKMIELIGQGSGIKLKRLIDAHWKLIILGHTANPGKEADLLSAIGICAS